MTLPETLPNEIWEECWSYLSVKQLKRIRFVCKTFRITAQRFLFRHLAVESPRHMVTRENWRSLTKGLVRAQEGIEETRANHALASMIKKWTFRGSRLDLRAILLDGSVPHVSQLHLLPDAYDALLHTFLGSLSLFSNVTYLELERTDISDSVATTLAQMPRLTRLHLAWCNLVMQIDHHLELKHFRFRFPPTLSSTPGMDPSQTRNLISSATLESLNLVGLEWVTQLLAIFTRTGPFPRLAHLYIHSEPEQDYGGGGLKGPLFKFLEGCPQVRTLVLEWPIIEFLDEDEGALSPSSLPLLEGFTGPIRFAPTFAVARALRYANFSLMSHTLASENAVIQDIFARLSFSGDTLQELIVEFVHAETRLFNVVSGLFPRLRKLYIRVLDINIGGTGTMMTQSASYSGEGAKWEPPPEPEYEPDTGGLYDGDTDDLIPPRLEFDSWSDPGGDPSLDTISDSNPYTPDSSSDALRKHAASQPPQGHQMPGLLETEELLPTTFRVSCSSSRNAKSLKF